MPQSGAAAPLKKTILSAEIPQFAGFHSWHLGCQECSRTAGTEKEATMLWTIAVILLVLWALGMITSYTAGGVVHLLLVVAVVVIVFQFFGGRRSV
jgi:Flp pilus assembly protein TadB